MPPRTRLRSSVASYESPDPLGLSENGVQRTTSPTKFSPQKASPRVSKHKQGPATPKSRPRNDDDQVPESRITSVSSHSIGPPGSRSPWKIRVTVEAEPEGENEPPTPTRQKRNMLTGHTITTTVPLREGDGGTPARRRGRPQKSAAETDSAKKRKRADTPTKKSLASEDDEGSVAHSVNAPDHAAASSTPLHGKRRRGRPRKSDAHEIDGRASTAKSPSATEILADSFEPIAAPVEEGPSADQEQGQGNNEPLRKELIAPSIVATKTLADRLSREDDTTALDLSAFESEGFSMVSIDSLRSERERAMKSAGSNEDARNNIRDKAMQIVPDSTQLFRTAALNRLQRPVKPVDVAPQVEAQAGEPDSDVSGLRPSELRPTRASAIQSSFGFGNGTIDHLRARYMMGELLSRGTMVAADQGTSAQTSTQPEQSSALSQQKPNASPPYPRLPTPAASVDEETTAHKRTPSAVSASHDERSVVTRDYDEMSWIPTNQATRVAKQFNARDADQMSWRPSTVQSASMRASGRRILPHTAFAGTPRAPEPSQVVGAASPQDVTMADDDMWQAEAERSMEESATGSEQPLPRLPDKTPDWNDLLGEDNRPRRAKIPRTWRRVSGDYFKYSDEVEGPDTLARSPELITGKPSQGLDQYYSSTEESSLEQINEEAGPNTSCVARVEALINNDTSSSRPGAEPVDRPEESLLNEESLVSEVIPRQPRPLFDPTKKYDRLFNAPPADSTLDENLVEGLDNDELSFVSISSDDEDLESLSSSEDEVADMPTSESQVKPDRITVYPRPTTGPGLYTRIRSWFLGDPAAPQGQVWNLNHWHHLESHFDKDRTGLEPPSLRKDLLTYINKIYTEKLFSVDVPFTKESATVVESFLREAETVGIPIVCDGQSFSASPLLQDNQRPSAKHGTVARGRESWDTATVVKKWWRLWMWKWVKEQGIDMRPLERSAVWCAQEGLDYVDYFAGLGREEVLEKARSTAAMLEREM